jgi:hypothetical protein
MRRIPWMFAGAVLSICATAACGAKTDGGTARVSLSLQDGSQPIGDSTSATATSDGTIFHGIVTVEQINLQPSDGSDEAGAVVLYDQPVDVDIMRLNAATRELVDWAIVPAGPYSELRLVISGGFIEVAGLGVFSSPDYPALPDGALVVGELRMPSYGSSGLKVTLPNGELVLGSDTEHVVGVDFDVSQSFGQAAASDAWVLHPVIHATDFTVGVPAASP